ncbi:MAG: preprotein translocase subunit SecG [Lachnospiraceae bacterium]|nr:preprotein translocase subunit SecG [Lachnospiraceae bacterium]
MAALKIVLTVLFVIVCLIVSVIVLLQEGKSAGLSSTISGVGETFWSKNKSRTLEGKLEKSTKWLVVAFFVLALILDIM